MAFQGHPVLGLLVLLDLLTNGIAVSPSHGIAFKDVNTIPEAVPVWPPVRYISDTGQYRCTVSDLLLFYIFNIYIYIYTHKISIYYKTLPQKSLFTIKH